MIHRTIMMVQPRIKTGAITIDSPIITASIMAIFMLRRTIKHRKHIIKHMLTVVCGVMFLDGGVQLFECGWNFAVALHGAYVGLHVVHNLHHEK